MDKRSLSLAALLAGAAFFAGTLWFSLDVYRPVERPGRPVLVNIPRGSSFSRAAEILDQAGLVKNRRFFHFLARLRHAASHVRAGEYELNTILTPAQVLQKLLQGEVKEYRVSIPEDFTVWEIAQRLGNEENRLVDPAEFLRLAADPEVIAGLGIEGETVEGYLYPDTYRFDRSLGAQEILRVMAARFWRSVTPDMVARARAMGFSVSQLVTLASLIGKESGNKEEKPLISSVFHNRLRLGMRLQSDPTAVYEHAMPDRQVRKPDLARRTPHNTYVIPGLPPGPIANPGLDSLRAVLEPAPSDYLYFVAKNDGTHHFSRDLPSHREAVIKYQIARKKE